MAITAVTTDFSTTGQIQERATIVTCDNNYPNPAGYTVTPAQLGLPGGIDWAIASVQNDGGGAAYDARYDVANQALHLYGSTGEVANATNLSTVTVLIVARGGY